MSVAGGTQRGGIDEIHVTRDDFREGVLGFGSREIYQQLVIGQLGHLSNDVHEMGKWTKNFVGRLLAVLSPSMIKVRDEGLFR